MKRHLTSIPNKTKPKPVHDEPELQIPTILKEYLEEENTYTAEFVIPPRPSKPPHMINDRGMTKPTTDQSRIAFINQYKEDIPTSKIYGYKITELRTIELRLLVIALAKMAFKNEYKTNQ
jgi:hypothetical protein